jgi:hypothetical protein
VETETKVNNMDVKRLVLCATLAATAGGAQCWANSPYGERMETIAPVVTAAAYQQQYAGLSGGVELASCGTGVCDSTGCTLDGGCDGGCGLLRGCTGGCDGGCDSGCDGLCAGGCDGLGGGAQTGLLGFGLIQRSDHCFDDFISPMTNPVFFEDPRTLTEARFIFINHQLPGALGGNSVQVYAMQVRAALTKRLSLIATKDGFIYTQSPVLDSGFADIAAGLKYNLYRDPVAGRLLSVGMTYEIPTGSNRSLQGNGNGEFHFFSTAGTRIGKRSHWLIASGIREAADRNLENSMVYLSNHFDYQLPNRPLYAFTELNWYNYTSSGSAFPLAVEGGDLFNLGAPGITGNDLVTHAIGMKAKPRSNVEAGVAWQYPMTARQGIMDNRLTADLIVRF